MADPSELTRLLSAKTPFDAQVVAGVLAEAGVPVHVDGEWLQDPAALVRALVNTEMVDVFVKNEDLARARKAMQEADSAAQLLDDPSFDPGPGDSA